MNHPDMLAGFEQSRRHSKPKTREVSSRFLSPGNVVANSPSTNSLQKPGRSSSFNASKHKTPPDSGLAAGLWPTSSPKQGTLADCFRNEKKMDLNKQHSYKESPNSKAMFGSGKLKFTGRSAKMLSPKFPSLSGDIIVPGRLSVDEAALRRRKSDYLSDFLADSESEQSDAHSGTSFNSPLNLRSSPASYMAPTASSRRGGIEVSSKYLLRSRTSSSAEKSAMKMVESPGRLSPAMVSEEKKGKGASKPPTSPSRIKGVGNLLSIGLDLLKGKKYHPNVSSPLGLGIPDSSHQLKLLHNRLLQWRFANATSETVNAATSKEAQRNLVYAWGGITKLRSSVKRKKMQLEKEMLEIKLEYILTNEIKPLEAWGSMERQHQSAITATKDSLEAVVCKVPLVKGAKVEPDLLFLALRSVSDVTGKIMSMGSKYFPNAHVTAATSRELTDIFIQEKLLLEECLEHFKMISELKVQEASLKCNLIQLKLR